MLKLPRLARVQRRRFVAAAALLASGLGGCGLLTPATRNPMDVVRPDAGPCGGIAPVLLVMLPGAYSRPREFVDEGFVGAVRQRGQAVDIVIADAHLGYFKERSVLQRLQADVVRPARAQGYRQIWLVGISLGGFAALGFGARHGDEIDGIVTIAPYLGRSMLLQEIEQAGGPSAWRRAPRAPIDNVQADDDDLERDVWRWLAESHEAPDSQDTAARLPVFLGYGHDDRFAPAHRLLATVLPADRSDEVQGDHDWPAWRTVWSDWLDRRLLPTACGAG